MSNLTIDQIKQIIETNKRSFKANLTNLIAQYISTKTNMDLRHATAIAKGLVEEN